jgi:hypothetical protein
MHAPRWVWATYLKWMLVTAVMTISVTGAFNAFMDPMGVFPSPRIAGVNAVKPFLDHHRELTRYHGALRICPNTGIFGNSRAGVGLDPNSPVLAAHGLSGYNHAIPGIGGRTTYQQILWLQAKKCLPETVFLGVDFFDFFGGSAPQPLPTLTTNPAPQRGAQLLAESVFSTSGLVDSLWMLWMQRAKYPSILTERGFNPMYNYIPEIESSGHYALFRQRATENVRSWARKPKLLRPLKSDASDDELMLNASITRLLSAGSTVHIIIYPYHAELRLLMERLGMGDLFSEWKRQVLASAERLSSQGGKVTVWDFSGISEETLETIPTRSDRRTHLRYYWEAGHFKRELGDKVLARILGQVTGFGVQLDTGMIDRWLADDQQRVRLLLDTPSALRDEVIDVIGSVHRKAQP